MPPSPAPASPSPSPSPAGSPPASPPRRQFVSFAFYKLLPDFRRLPPDRQSALLAEFVELLQSHNPDLILLTYSTIGTRPDTDFMLWKIAWDLAPIQKHAAALNRLPLAGYLATPYSYLAQTKRSTYVDKLDPAHDDARTVIQPGRYQYTFVYPFVKTRAWYQLSKPARQGIMDEHIAIGTKYPSVRLNTTYSFGLDDQEFVVAFETDHPSDFLDLVQELRESEGSKYTQRDTPIFTCVKTPPAEIARQLACI